MNKFTTWGGREGEREGGREGGREGAYVSVLTGRIRALDNRIPGGEGICRLSDIPSIPPSLPPSLPPYLLQVILHLRVAELLPALLEHPVTERGQQVRVLELAHVLREGGREGRRREGGKVGRRESE